ncbi:MAG: zinc-dependent metalloprotease [Actinomycetaceae bacterium]|nr:zinc-dependent metalloprotease [Actinomycetaceae bacterium]MDY6083404.1 zinc-dependent metalloprotease [Actinomycetaceae bacterium]
MTDHLSSDSDSHWEDMLRAILGDQAAEEILNQMREQGIDPSQIVGSISASDVPMIARQIRELLGSAGTGSINWKAAEQIARETLVTEHPDTVSSSVAQDVRSALSTANLWLDPATAFDPWQGPYQAFSRLDWLAHSLPTYKKLTQPVGEHIAAAFESVMQKNLQEMPEQFSRLLGPNPTTMFDQMVSTILGLQYGAGLAQLATITFGTADAGIPLVEGSLAALVPANIEDFADGLDITEAEITLYLAVREQAAARLFSRVSWLRPRILDAIEAYSRDIDIDMDAIASRAEEFQRDPSLFLSEKPDISIVSLTDVVAQNQSDLQQQMVTQIGYLLAMVEGWVTTITVQAVAPHLPHAVALSEMMMRRAATESPINKVFGSLISLEVAPAMLREAAHFWQLATAKMSAADRDALWSHPDLLPHEDDLHHPENFFTQHEPSDLDKELDAFLDDVLSSADESGSDGGSNQSSDSSDSGRDHHDEQDHDDVDDVKDRRHDDSPSNESDAPDGE